MSEVWWPKPGQVWMVRSSDSENMLVARVLNLVPHRRDANPLVAIDLITYAGPVFSRWVESPGGLWEHDASLGLNWFRPDLSYAVRVAAP